MQEFFQGIIPMEKEIMLVFNFAQLEETEMLCRIILISQAK